METMQKLPQSSLSTVGSNSYSGSCKDDAGVCDQFPAGLRVLVVDDDTTCLKILEQMLRRCLYQVTTCLQATVALNLLRERKGCFDVVLSDVHMPDMDGFKLLELVGLEMDLPVIMMSADGTTSAVMRGVRHGACDYLIKPIREAELKNIWQHVVRKKWNENKELEHSGSLEDNERHKRGIDDAEYSSSFNEATDGMFKAQKKRRDTKEEEDGELENDDGSASKKPRVVWSVELHQQFVGAVNQLGIDKAVPKRILELMNVPGLTRENVASHLQKFRLYLKRLSGVASQGGLPNPFCGPVEANVKLGPLGRFDIQALAASGQIPPQTLAALHAELLDRPTGGLMLPSMDPPALLQASLHSPKCIPVEHSIAFGQPLMKCPSNISKHFPQPVISVDEISSGFGSWPSIVGPSGNSNVLMDILQQKPQNQQHKQHQQQQQQKSMLPEPSRTINVQPSCLVVPAQSSPTFQPRNNSSLGIVQMSEGEFKSTGVISGYSAPTSLSPTLTSCSVSSDISSMGQVPDHVVKFNNPRQLPQLVPNICDNQGSFGFVGKGTCIPSRFAVDELDPAVSNFKFYGESNGNRVKQEPSLDFMESAKVDIPILQHYSPNDLMSVLSE